MSHGGRRGCAQVAYAVTAPGAAASGEGGACHWLLEKHDGLTFTWGCGGGPSPAQPGHC